MPAPALLQREVETYEAKKAELLGASEGQFVLIKDDQVIGVFEAEFDAIAQGYRQFGNVPFLVRQILRVHPTHHFGSNRLAL